MAGPMKPERLAARPSPKPEPARATKNTNEKAAVLPAALEEISDAIARRASEDDLISIVAKNLTGNHDIDRKLFRHVRRMCLLGGYSLTTLDCLADEDVAEPARAPK